MTTMNILVSSYGFEARLDGSLFWGRGSLVWGDTVEVSSLGADLYEVKVAHWLYSCEMEPVVDTEETRVLHGGEALGWVFTELPEDFWQ